MTKKNDKFDEVEFAKEFSNFQKALRNIGKPTIAERIGSFLGGLTVAALLVLIISLGLLAIIYVWSLIIAL